MATQARMAKTRRKLKFNDIRQRNRCKVCVPAARLHAQVRPVPPLFPEARALRLFARRRQGELVGDTYEHDRSDCGFAGANS